MEHFKIAMFPQSKIIYGRTVEGNGVIAVK